MRRTLGVVAAALTLTALGVGTTNLPAGAAASAGATDSTRVYLVVLREAPVASYQGGIRSLAATAPPAGARFDTTAATVVAYRAHLLDRQTSLLERLGNPPRVYSYTTALNGFAARLTQSQVKTAQTAPEVLLVEPDARVTVDRASPDAARDGRQTASGASPAAAPRRLWSQVGGADDAGRGVVVGVIDTGVWPDNPSLAGIPLSASTLDRAYPGFTGSCQVGAGWSGSTCSSKVVAARFFVRGYGRANVAQSDYLSPRDSTGHGTSVAAIAAGYAGIDTRIEEQDLGHIAGVAPAAALSIYKACWTAPDPARDGCDVADTVKAIDQAVDDGVDVINYSIGTVSAGAGSIGEETTELADAVQLAFLNAAAANVFVAAPAGNGGPASGTVQHPGPWMTTVGAITGDRFQGGVRLGDGRTLVGAMLSDKRVGPAPLVHAHDVAAGGVSSRRAGLCYPGSLNARQVEGAIVVCDRGVTSRVSKGAAVAQGGGAAMVLVNTRSGSVDADLQRVPTVHVDVGAAAQVKAYIARAGESAVASLLPAETGHALMPAVADFSGRGPSAAVGGGPLKPDLAAPGVNVISAAAPASGSAQLWNVVSGTSIASPHVAGVAAVVKAAHPTWTPAAIKSAMLTTARALPGVTSPFSRGAGEVDPGAVLDPGLVYDTGIQDWSRLLRGQAIRVTGYASGSARLDPGDVNAASISVGALVGPRTITRTVTNVSSSTQRYTATTTGLRGIARSIAPGTLTLEPGRSATFTITLSATKDARYGVFSAGSLVWRAATGTTVASPVVVRPELAETPAELTVTGRHGSATIDARAGVTGTIQVATSGLVAATPVPFELEPGATAGDTISVPEGSRAARFQVTSGAPGDDVDLFVYRGDTLVAAATSGSGSETVTLSTPRAGSYRVHVSAYEAGDGPLVHGTLTSWVLPRVAPHDLHVARRSIGVDGDAPFSVVVRWAGLDTDRRWWGYVAYRDLPDVTYVTVN